MPSPVLNDLGYLKTGIIHPKPPLKDPFITAYCWLIQISFISQLWMSCHGPVFSRRDTLGVIHQNNKYYYCFPAVRC